MMKQKGNYLVILVSIILAIIGSFLIYREFNTRMQAALMDIEKDQVQRLVVIKDLEQGDILTSENVGIRIFPKQWLPSYSLDPEDFHLLEGKVLNRYLRKGDLLGQIFVEAPLLRFSEKIKPGYRAVTIAVDDLNSVSGMISPGDLIDLYLSFVHDNQSVSAPLLQQVRVLATGNEIEEKVGQEIKKNYSTVTLEIKPEDALKLMSSKQEGQITALLRSPVDKEDNYKATQGDMANLLGIPGMKKSGNQVKVIYGNESGSNQKLEVMDEKQMKALYPFFDLKESEEEVDSERLQKTLKE